MQYITLGEASSVILIDNIETQRVEISNIIYEDSGLDFIHFKGLQSEAATNKSAIVQNCTIRNLEFDRLSSLFQTSEFFTTDSIFLKIQNVVVENLNFKLTGKILDFKH